MKYLLPLLFVVSSAWANLPTMTNIVQVSTGQEVTWTTQSNHNYQVDLSTDLLTEWIDSGIIEQGTGTNVTYGFSSDADDLCFRVRETDDIYNGALMTLPVNDQTNRLGEGVGIAFDLNVFTNATTNLPASISIYLREYDSGDPWEQYGYITNFMERAGIRFVRGSVVWIPDETGVYEMRSVVKEGAGTVCGVADRKVTILPPPMVTINTGPPTQSSNWYEDADFTTTLSDSFGSITYVEFHDFGAYIGRDSTFPYGDSILDTEGNTPALHSGDHNITARAVCGIVKGDTSNPFPFTITGYSAPERPKLLLSSPTNEITVMQGDPFVITFSVTNSTNSVMSTDVVVTNAANSTGVTVTTTPLETASLDTTGWDAGTHTVKVFARDRYDSYNSYDSYPQYVDVYVETTNRLAFAEMLVSNIVDEASVTVSNVQYRGVMAASTNFTGGTAAGLQIDEGVVLTTGLASFWNLGNVSDSIHEGLFPYFPPGFINNKEPGDPILDLLINANYTADAAILNYEVITTGEQIEVEYQLASEEYIEHVETHNDSMVAAIDGIAVSLVPSGTTITAVHSVNDVIPENEHLYLSSTNIQPIASANRIEYNGAVISLKSFCLVKKGPHKIHISIADVNDQIFDSAVFMRRNSLRSSTMEKEGN